MRRLGIASLLLAACSDPSALEVTISIEESDLVDLHVVIRRGTAEDAPEVFDCAMRLDDEPEGLCPLEGGDGRWIDPARVSFVLYGEPGTEVALAVDGRREFENPRTGETTLAVVTTTAASASLPANAGERSLLELPLVDRTSERFRCQTEVATTDLTDFGSVVLVEAGEYIAYTAVADELARVRYRRSGDTCTLMSEAIGDRLPCRVRARSMVARATPDGESVMLAGLCANGMAGMTTLLAMLIEEDRMVPAMTMIPIDRPRVTQPIIANFDLSNAGPEVGVVHARTRNDVRFFGWMPFTDTSTEIPLDGVSVTLSAGETLPSPIVVRGRAAEPVLVAGYGGANGVVWPNRGRLVFTQLEAVSGVSRRAPALALGEPPILVDVRSEEVRFTELRFASDRTPWAGEAWSSPLVATVERDLDKRVAIARAGEDEVLHAVFTENGVVELHPFDRRAPSSFDAWGDGIDGAQHTLLWNMDGRPGAEIITYDTEDRDLFGNALSGRALDGWDPLIATQRSENITVALAKLGGPGDLDLDVVILAGRTLEVITLGQNSAPVREFSWPLPNHDSAGTATWVEGTREPVIAKPL